MRCAAPFHLASQFVYDERYQSEKVDQSTRDMGFVASAVSAICKGFPVICSLLAQARVCGNRVALTTLLTMRCCMCVDPVMQTIPNRT